MKAQVSLEYLIIIALATILIIPTFYIFYVQTQDSNSQVIATRVDRFGDEVLKQSKTIYYTGRYARTAIDFEFPENVINVSTRQDPSSYPRSEFVVTIAQGRFNQSVVFFSDVPLFAGNCSSPGFNATPHDDNPLRYTPGLKTVIIESCGNYTAVYEER